MQLDQRVKSESEFSVPNFAGIKRQVSESTAAGAAMSNRLEEVKMSLTQSRKRELKQDTKLESIKNISSQVNSLKIKHESLSKKSGYPPSLIKSESAPA